MHNSSLVRMQWFCDQYAHQLDGDLIRVLDVGSQDVNGSYRHVFSGSRFQYTGLDMEPGPNVDHVLTSPYDWSAFADDSFDIIISGQAFEHIEFFWVTLSEVVRVLKKQGLLCLIVPNVFFEHRYPVDCYRFYTDGMVSMARYTCLETLHAHTDCAPEDHQGAWSESYFTDAMLVARKPYNGPARHPEFSQYRCQPADHKALMAPLKPTNL